MIDHLNAYKRDVEERDRIEMLAADARKLMTRWTFSWRDDYRSAIVYLMRDGPFSWGDAHRALEFIDWEDSRNDE